MAGSWKIKTASGYGCGDGLVLLILCVLVIQVDFVRFDLLSFGGGCHGDGVFDVAGCQVGDYVIVISTGGG